MANKGDALLGACSVPAVLDAVGERWSLMILRAAMGGVRHFEAFQGELGIARNILSNRLHRLVDLGILERHAMPGDRRRIDYRLTAKGAALMPAMVALRQWGERWGAERPAVPLLVDARDGRPVRAVVVLAHDGRVLAGDDVVWTADAVPAAA